MFKAESVTGPVPARFERRVNDEVKPSLNLPKECQVTITGVPSHRSGDIGRLILHRDGDQTSYVFHPAPSFYEELRGLQGATAFYRRTSREPSDKEELVISQSPNAKDLENRIIYT